VIIQGKNTPNQVPVKRVAAIDLGTNSFHAIIVDIYPDGSFRTIDKLKEMVQLAKGGLGKKLTDGAIRRGMDALKHIKLLCDNQDVEQILAYATSAIREAKNGGEFIQRCIDELDIKINAIPGRLEAELIGYAVQHGVKLTDDPVLMVDIGGGSVEFVIGNKDTFHFLTSKKLGVARMTDIFKPSDPITEEDIATLERHYENELHDLAEAFAQYRSDTIIGSSGTMQNIAAMIAAKNNKAADLSLNEMEFTAKEFRDFYTWFIKLSRKERKKISELDSKRVNIINTGMVLLKFLIEKFGIATVKISEQALREGIIIRYLKKDMIGMPWSGEEFRDPRRRSVFELLRKCHWHEKHSRHVTQMALKLFEMLKDQLGLYDSDRELLEYAGYMHDIGYHISHSAHHKHALYIIRNAELKGFKEDEIEIMANVARYHRRSTPKKRHEYYWRLQPELRRRIRKLSGILRVADGLDRSHYQNVKDFDLELTDDEILIRIYTESDPELEIWGAMRKCNLFEQITGRKLRIQEAETEPV